MQIIENVIQRSEEWFKLRELRMTGSHATAIKANGKGLATYIREKVLIYYGLEKRKHFENEDILRGIELEPLARFAYEIETGYSVKEVGFVIHNDYVGASPDGLVLKEKGGTEIKAKNNKNHLALIEGDNIDSGDMNQCQMNMLVCELEWIDFVSFNPNFKKELFIKRIKPDQKAVENLKTGFKAGEKMIKSIMKQFS